MAYYSIYKYSGTLTNSLNLTVLQDLLAEFCRHTDCSQDFKMSALYGGSRDGHDVSSSRLCMHACVRVKNDNHISGNAWPEQVVGLVKRVALC